jgi:hypothetical protein
MLVEKEMLPAPSSLRAPTRNPLEQWAFFVSFVSFVAFSLCSLWFFLLSQERTKYDFNVFAVLFS